MFSDFHLFMLYIIYVNGKLPFQNLFTRAIILYYDQILICIITIMTGKVEIRMRPVNCKVNISLVQLWVATL